MWYFQSCFGEKWRIPTVSQLIDHYGGWFSFEYLIRGHQVSFHRVPSISVLMYTDNNQAKFGSSGGIEVLLDICKHHMNNAAVMRQACDAIKSACENNGMCVYGMIHKHLRWNLIPVRWSSIWCDIGTINENNNNNKEH